MAADGRRGSRRARRALEGLAAKGFNFDPDPGDHYTTENGWKVDNYLQPRAVPSAFGSNSGRG